MSETNRVVSFEDENLILVDENDKVIGFNTKDVCHDGDGILHRAFSIFIFNSKNELLLQQRAIGKRLWGGYWSNTCCSHPRKNETFEYATERRLEEELGMRSDMHYIYKFQYQSRFKDLGSENELCHVYVGRSEAEPKINDTEIEAWRYISPADLDRELKEFPEKYTPWFKMEWKNLREKYWQAITAM